MENIGQVNPSFFEQEITEREREPQSLSAQIAD
jgi:hypothetical protein